MNLNNLYLFKKVLLFFFICNSLHSFSQTVNSVVTFQEDSLWGLKDTLTAKIIIPPKYQSANYFLIAHKIEDSVYFTETNILVKLNNKYGFIDKTGKQIVPFIYDDVESLCWEKNRRARVFKGKLGGEYNFPLDGLYGFIDPFGKEVIPLIYKNANVFYNYITTVQKDSLYAFIDTTGKLLTPFKYENSFGFNDEGFASVVCNGKYGIIDTTGNEIISCKYGYIREEEVSRKVIIKNGLFQVINFMEKGLIKGLVNTQGIEVIPCIYYHAEAITDNLILVIDTIGKRGIFNISGKELIPCKYDHCEIYESDSMITVAIYKSNIYEDPEAGYWYGFVNTDGKEVIAPKYEQCKDFKEGLAVVMQNGKWGYIDKKGNIVIEFKYDEVESFENGKAKIKIKETDKIIDKTGKETLN